MVDEGEGNDCTKAAIMQCYRNLVGLRRFQKGSKPVGECFVDLRVDGFLVWMGVLPA